METHLALIFSGGAMLAAFIVPLSLHYLAKQRDDLLRRDRAKNIAMMVFMELAGVIPVLKALEQCSESIKTRPTMESLELMKYRFECRGTPVLDKVVEWISDMDKAHARPFSIVYTLVSQYRQVLREAFAVSSVDLAKYKLQQLQNIAKELRHAILALPKEISDLLPEETSYFSEIFREELETKRVLDSRPANERGGNY